jgi:hypothetical protein
MDKPWIGIPTRDHAESETIGQIRHYSDAVVDAGGFHCSFLRWNLPQSLTIILNRSTEYYCRAAQPTFIPDTMVPKRIRNLESCTPSGIRLILPLQYATRHSARYWEFALGAESQRISWRTAGPRHPSLIPQAVVHDESRHKIKLEEQSSGASCRNDGPGGQQFSPSKHREARQESSCCRDSAGWCN